MAVESQSRAVELELTKPSVSSFLPHLLGACDVCVCVVRRCRVVFAQLAMEHPHILLLDEPTNHLYMASIYSLARAIKDYEGGVVIVSHDFRKFYPLPRSALLLPSTHPTPFSPVARHAVCVDSFAND